MTRLALVTMLLVWVASSAQARHHHASASSGAPAGQFDYYLLSLSWAPTYCLNHASDGAECSGRGYGFVVHGLWPQYDAGGYPKNCSTSFELTTEAASKGQSLYPSEHLMWHEWQEHGTCSGLDALSYFQTVDRATAAIRIPASLETPKSDQSLTAAQLIALFQDANPRLPPDALTFACSRADFSEVRVCLTRNLTVRSCGHGVRTTCPSVALAIPASR
jgi:ribonuclease T2